MTASDTERHREWSRARTRLTIGVTLLALVWPVLLWAAWLRWTDPASGGWDRFVSALFVIVPFVFARAIVSARSRLVAAGPGGDRRGALPNGPLAMIGSVLLLLVVASADLRHALPDRLEFLAPAELVAIVGAAALTVIDAVRSRHRATATPAHPGRASGL